MPRTIIAGNWKMHKTAAETAAYIHTFLRQFGEMPAGVDVVLCPPFTALAQAKALLSGRGVFVGAQNMHWEEQGAYTGEISASMLFEHGVDFVIVGHSERRQYFNELDSTVNLKVKAALEHKMTPIIAVGETLEEREAGTTDERVSSQVRAALQGLGDQQIGRVVIAYEPIWAIGTGRNCEPGEAQRVMAVIRRSVASLEHVPILYGGSMKADNVSAYMSQPGINGGLVGGASLDPHGFAALVRNAL